jgi:hypothetical protein
LRNKKIQLFIGLGYIVIPVDLGINKNAKTHVYILKNYLIAS